MSDRSIVVDEAAKKVAQVLAENRVTYSEVRRVFMEAERYLLVQTERDQTRAG